MATPILVGTGLASHEEANFDVSPALLGFPTEAANGWYALMVPIGAVISVGLLTGLLRSRARDWFSED